MAKQEETVFLERVDHDLKSHFGDNIEIENIQQKAKYGTADRLICLYGDFIALEGKTLTGEASAIQVAKLLRIRRAGGKAYIIAPDNWAEIFNHFKKVYD